MAKLVLQSAETSRICIDNMINGDFAITTQAPHPGGIEPGCIVFRCDKDLIILGGPSIKPELHRGFFDHVTGHASHVSILPLGTKLEIAKNY